MANAGLEVTDATIPKTYRSSATTCNRPQAIAIVASTASVVARRTVHTNNLY